MVIMALLSNKSVSNAADAFNLMKERSADSEFTSNYNCGGYALETYNWFLPFFNGSAFSAYMWQQVCEYNGWDYDYDCLENGTTEGEVIFSDYEDEIIQLLAKEILANPQDEDEEDEDYAYDLAAEFFWSGDFNHPAAVAVAIKLMIQNFNLRPIECFDDLNEDEYGIAFATQTGGGDFHFFKYRDGIFSHKMGNCYVEEFDVPPTLDNISNLFAGMGYDSNVHLFAKKKQ